MSLSALWLGLSNMHRLSEAIKSLVLSLKSSVSEKVIVPVQLTGFYRKPVIVVLGLLISMDLYSHPHSWIDLQTTLYLNDAGQLTQIIQRWEFDPYYSSITLADLKKEYPNEMEGLQFRAEEMVRNLRDYHYFSDLRIDGFNVPMGTPNEYSLNNKRREAENILELEMAFDLGDGVTLKQSTLTLQVYDPTYYIAMAHSSDDHIHVISHNALSCQKKLITPEPPNDLISYALSLDRNETSSNGLGIKFAETVEIRCSSL